MGSSQSSHASTNDVVPKGNEPVGSSVRGRKTTTAESVGEAPVLVSKTGETHVDDADDVHSDSTEETDNESSYDEEEEEEEDEFFVERLRILEDARNLKKLAEAFAHPELPVKVDGSAMGRNYFSRPSAEEQESAEEAEERAQILADAAAMKKLATDYAHPEVGVTTSDPAACGRNYFDRPSAEAQESLEEADERAQVLADAEALKKAAFDYLHPEVGVEQSDPTSFGRNYFNRPSPPEQETLEEAEERARVLADAAALKKHAVDYAHPEAPVETDGSSFGRNYFERPSAHEQETEEDTEERAIALADAASLKKLAVDYAHPEAPVETDGASFGRNYFERASAPERETEEEAEERAAILAECAALKKLAVDYAHPEKQVEVAAAAFGRNYFSRASAPDQDDVEETEERAAILAEAASLKKLAVDYAHPENPVDVDSAACARNYFSRLSAPAQEMEEDAEEHAQILAEAAALKKLASDFAHPEKPVDFDATATARSYFTRPSAPIQETEEDAEECAQILAEAAAFKKLASNYAHPETPVEVASEAFGRNYFARPSASEQETEEDAEERALVLAEVAALKKLAVDYAHPEVGVTNTDPASFGRNYFNRPSAPLQEGVSGTSEVAAAKVATERADDYDYFVPGEEQFDALRDDLEAKNQPTAADKNRKVTAEGESDEGSLSRSPSSVMLFGYEDNQAF